MGMFTLYALKSAFCLAMLYLPYALLLRRETFFRLNRAVLLGILVLSAVLPAIDVPVSGGSVFHSDMQVAQCAVEQADWRLLLAVRTDGSAGTAGQETTVGWSERIVLLYIIGVFLSLAFRLWQFVRMRRFMRSGCLWTHRAPDGVTVYCHVRPCAPFSWMHAVVLSQADYDESGREILLHERAHIACRHSWDALAVTLFQAWQWFNPFVRLLAADLRDLHEYEADRAVLRSGTDERGYQLLILKKAVGTSSYALANSLNHSNHLKKRITMMKKRKSPAMAQTKFLALLPAAAVALTVMARPEVAVVGEELAEAKVTNSVEILQTSQTEKSDIALRADRQAVVDTSRVVIVRQRKGEETVADTAKAEPLILINGKRVDREILLSMKPENISKISFSSQKMGESDVVGGREVIYIMVNDSTKAESNSVAVVPAVREDGTTIINVNCSSEKVGTDNEPLVVLNGRVVELAEMSALSSDKVISVTVLKGLAAVEAWGDRGRNGVVIMEVKRDK